jgi:pSer/pThr/pTyr-binding forkhead associated (FHA) protein
MRESYDAVQRSGRSEPGASPNPAATEKRMNSELFLVLRTSGHPVVATRLRMGDLTIGRASHNDISFALDTISRIHARLTVGIRGVIITDLGSRNGTFVNQKRIQCASVFPGELIQLGSVNLLLSQGPSGEGGLDLDEITLDAKSYYAGINQSTPTPLSPAQTKVFDLLVQGHLEKGVADELKLSVHTVHNHIRKIYQAYGVTSRVELLLKVMPR